MAIGAEVLLHLIPTGGWVISGDEFDSIVYDDNVAPVSKSAFSAAFAEVDALKTEQATAKEIAKQSILDRLGITAEEAKLLLS